MLKLQGRLSHSKRKGSLGKQSRAHNRKLKCR